MTARLLIASILLSGPHGAIASCPPLGRPIAPPPRHVQQERSDAAELLVGTWKVVKQENPALPQGHQYSFEFTAEGDLWIRVFTDRDKPVIESGLYSLKQNRLTLTILASTRKAGRKWTLVVEKLTKDELVLSEDSHAKNRQRAVLRRNK